MFYLVPVNQMWEGRMKNRWFYTRRKGNVRLYTVRIILAKVADALVILFTFGKIGGCFEMNFIEYDTFSWIKNLEKKEEGT